MNRSFTIVRMATTHSDPCLFTATVLLSHVGEVKRDTNQASWYISGAKHRPEGDSCYTAYQNI